MIQPEASNTRHTIPRWNTINTSIALGEMDSYAIRPKSLNQNRKNELDLLLGEWEHEQSLPLAVEIISANRFVESNVDISNVLTFIKNLESAGTKLPLLVQELIDKENETTVERMLPLNYRESISRTKKALAQFPRNPLMWSELGREYLVSGEIKKSEKAMHVALSLAPNDRTIVRSVARLYIHTGELDKARYYLDNCDLVNIDPWILASEIALLNQMGKSSRLVKRGREMLLNQNYSPLALSELASELSTMDFSSGNSKQGKRKIQIVQNHLHENAFAQLVWVNKNVYNLSHLIAEAPSPSCNFEAIAKSHYFMGEWNKAFQYTGKWLEYQPFSREPALLGSYIAADLIGDVKKAHEAICCGLKSNPNDSTVVNNYIYISILMSNFSTAQEYMKKASAQFDISADVLLTATNGLLLYRTGYPDAGLEKYKEAVAIADKQKDDVLQCRAAIYLAREEKRVGHDISPWIKYIDKYSKEAFFSDCIPLLEAFNLFDGYSYLL